MMEIRFIGLALITYGVVLIVASLMGDGTPRHPAQPIDYGDVARRVVLMSLGFCCALFGIVLSTGG